MPKNKFQNFVSDLLGSNLPDRRARLERIQRQAGQSLLPNEAMKRIIEEERKDGLFSVAFKGQDFNKFLDERPLDVVNVIPVGAAAKISKNVARKVSSKAIRRFESYLNIRRTGSVNPNPSILGFIPAFKNQVQKSKRNAIKELSKLNIETPNTLKEIDDIVEKILRHPENKKKLFKMEQKRKKNMFRQVDDDLFD